MRATPSFFASLLASVLAVTALSVPADAACKKFGFTVNDYGKEGPTNDAKNLLDKHISEWAAQNGVKEYQTGKKSVSCELFLDVILFDEHTCTASATVCWGPGVKPNNGAQSAGAPAAPAAGEAAPAATAAADDSGAGHPPSPVSKAEALGIPPQQAAAAPAASAVGEMTPTAAAAEAPPAAAAPTTPVDQAANDGPPVPLTPQAQAQAPTPPPASSGATLETGTLQAGQGLAPAAKDRAAAASAAASAAAAAERAAAAAETAANAAKEAAAAAVAASAASKSAPATVPPLDHASGAKPTHNE